MSLKFIVLNRAMITLTAVVLAVAVSCGVATVDAFAQDPMIYVDVADLAGHVGQVVEIPFYVQTLEDSLDGFQITLALSRPDLMYFEVDTVVVGDDTSFVCQFDTVGALTSGWEHIQARSRGGSGLDLRLSGMSEFPDEVVTPGIADYTSGVLMRVYGRIRSDVPDTMPDRIVDINIHDGTTYYSNEHGELILPAENLDGSVFVEEGERGDVNCDGIINPVDAVLLVNYVYKNWNDLCSLSLGDVNCDTAVNPVDVVILVNHVYKNWPLPSCE